MALVYAGAAYGQTAPAGDQQAPADQAPPPASITNAQTGQPSASDIVVTGSRIRGVAPVGSPIIQQ
jgi:iron complex outermembrane receptor protein